MENLRVTKHFYLFEHSSIHNGTVFIIYIIRESEHPGETERYWATVSQGHGLDKLLRAAQAWRRYSQINTTHGKRLASHRKDRQSRDDAAIRQIRPFRYDNLRNDHAGRYVPVQFSEGDENRDYQHWQ